MSLPDLVKFTFAGAPGIGFARWTLVSSTTYDGFYLGGQAIVPTLSKSGSTWTLDMDDQGGDTYTGTCAATSDGGFSLTLGDWTKTAGTVTLSTVVSVLDSAAAVAIALAHPVSASYRLSYTLS